MTNLPNDDLNNNSASSEENFFSEEEPNKNWDSQRKKNNGKRKAKKALLISAISLCLVVFITLASVVILNEIGKRKLLEENADIEKPDNLDVIIYDDGSIFYKGTLYAYNQNVTGILMLGIDRENIESNEAFGENGQADTIMLITVDTETGEAKITAIPRDTVTEVDIYSKTGSFSTTETTQICLAYAYGDGKTLSCENTAKAVSKFLMGMPVNSYFAADYSMVAKINDTLGGVTVTPNISFQATRPHYSTVYSFEKGVPVTLKGDNTLAYLRYRDLSTTASYLRMERQMDYLNKLADKVTEKTKSDITYPVTLFNTFSKESVNNLSADKITFLTSSIFTNREAISFDFKKVEGKQIIGEDGYAEFYADKDKLFELVLDLFYKPIG